MPDTLTDAERILLQIEGALPRLLFVLVGPSGVGKNTIIRKLLTNNPYMDRIRTYTTRPPRPDEIQGEQYHFVSYDEFRKLAVAGKLLEADAAIEGHDVYGQGKLYSMPKDLFADIDAKKHLVIAEVDVHGMRRLREIIPDCVTIFVFGTPVDLQQHILERPDDHMDQASLGQRMKTAREQIRSAGEFDYLVFNENDRLDDAVKLIEAIILAERARVRHGIDLQKTIAPEAFGQMAGRDSSA